MKSIKSPIVLFIYKRPKHTKKLINILNKILTNKIYIIADGYKNSIDKPDVIKTRNLINKIKTRKIIKIFFNKNVGLRKNAELGLNKVFKLEKRAIILEDDTLPNLSFFSYCDILLRKYRLNKKISMICGSNFKEDISKKYKNDYFFSKYPFFWGWATWDDRWRSFDNKMIKWSEYKSNKKFKKKFPEKREFRYWKERFNFHYNYLNKGTWDYPFMLKHFFYDKISIVPKINLIKNIGYDEPTSINPKKTSNLKTSSIKFPLKHPKNYINEEYDLFCSTRLFSKSKLLKRIKNKIKLIFKKMI